MRFCRSALPHKEWDMGVMDFAHTGWWGWHLIAIFAIFFLGYTMRGNRYKYND